MLGVVRYGIAASALKRGYSYSDLMRIVRTGDYLGPIRDGLVCGVGVGETSDGIILEVAGFTTDDNTAIIINHAMPRGWRYA